jgi:hypothetical protein
MLDLFIAADLVRKQTQRALGTDGPARRPRTPEQRRPLRSRSAAALRGLAELLEPSRQETVTG